MAWPVNLGFTGWLGLDMVQGDSDQALVKIGGIYGFNDAKILTKLGTEF